MVNTPPPHLAQGIHLVEAGRRGEALPHLRYAVQHEPVTAEGWLWLAAATDDRDEYGSCVEQALRLDPYHPVAARMRQALTAPYPQAPFQGWEPLPTELDTQREDLITQHRVPRRRGRLWRWLALLVIVVACGGTVAALAATGVLQDAMRDLEATARDWLSVRETHTLEFTVGEQPGYRFRVEVPETWMPANLDNASWRDTRDALMATFPAPDDQDSVWEQVEASFSGAIRDPVYGRIIPNVRLVETDGELVEQSGMVAALTLHEIVPLPDPPPGEDADVCARMRLLEQNFRASGVLASQSDINVLDAAVIARHDQGDCALTVDRRYTQQAPHQVMFPLSTADAPTATRAIMIAVPVGSERYAMWEITLADAAYDDYRYAVDRILSTLEYPGSE